MIEIKKIYVANNGDVFLIKNNDYKEHTNEEIKDLLERANKMYENGEYEECEYIQGKITNYGGYKDKDGEFLGNEQIHILNEFSNSQQGIYLKYNNNLPLFWKLLL